MQIELHRAGRMVTITGQVTLVELRAAVQMAEYVFQWYDECDAEERDQRKPVEDVDLGVDTSTLKGF